MGSPKRAASTIDPLNDGLALPAPLTLRQARIPARPLIGIRWIAMIGQTAALLFAILWLGASSALWIGLGVVAFSVLVNLCAQARLRRSAFLREGEAAGYLAYDMTQLAALLFLTGGIDNPFAVLMLAPLMVAASTLRGRSTLALGLLVVAHASWLSLFAHPLPWPGEGPIVLPPLYQSGLWAALILAAAFTASYIYRVTVAARRLAAALAASQAALARARQASAVGALAAAAAHELGTPLGTIAVIAKELARDIGDDPHLKEDIELLQSQAARCRDILAELAHRPNEQSDGQPPLPLAALLQSLALAYARPDIHLCIEHRGAAAQTPPQLRPLPEVTHGIANILQNALQFAHSKVEATLDWAPPCLSLSIKDDGPGFPPSLLGRLGEPYVSGRDGDAHMGLGLFIAQTLLERSGASVRYANEQGGGACVVIRWERPAFILPGS
jgi:two-component system, sensor histidine kinase RegB